MATSGRIADADARERALTPDQSFIVQAPAGSGKTGLLAQRYLTLLARAAHPEEIVAITFTRKAANEMRERVLAALDAARSGLRPAEPHAARTWDLARTALERDIALGWQLSLNPGRLRIHTIDSFCSALVRQMPYLSRFGAPPVAAEDPPRLYREAARAALAHLEEDDRWSVAVERLLAHFDNNHPAAAAQIAAMLARRDQWLRHVADGRGPADRRARLEAALAAVNHEALARLAALAPAVHAPEATALARYAAGRLAAQPEHPLHACASLPTWPGGAIEQREAWQGLAALLLTKDGEWRKQVSKTIGFPPGEKGLDPAEHERRKAMKQRMEALLEALRGREDFRAALAALPALPPPRYADGAWEAAEALIEVLLLAVAELKLAFTASGQADFIEVTRGALDALGGDEAPTDLALHLDYRIRHLLVDEFQDTSVSQYRLLERLTAGWQPGDGRTLFVVGDPMQSVYRFRQAEVGLYLRAWRDGIGDVPLTPLRLEVNFRSQEGIVGWVNRVFPSVLPAAEDVAAGAVPYAPAVASKPAAPGEAVSVHPFLGADPEAEARRVVGLVTEAMAATPDGKIAVLVRNRGHLARIAPRLKAAGLAFRALEIEPLAARPVVQDLLALTRALTHLADRAAWLALLRAPWCGLTLADLTALAGDDPEACIWALARGEARRALLSADGRARLERVLAVLERALAECGRAPLRRVVEGAWLALGGPAAVVSATELEDAQLFLELLESLEEGGTLAEGASLTERMAELYAVPDVAASERLQLMTIHKAKGLEFDTVILPGLGYRPRADESPLLLWMEPPHGGGDGTADLLLAPVRAAGAGQDRLYEFLRRLDAEKSRYESGRLLYVAATRAMRRLHLLGHTAVKPDGALADPDPRSLLALLWEAVRERFAGVHAGVAVAPVPAAVVPVPNLRRLAAGWRPPPLPPPPAWEAGPPPPQPAGRPAVEFDWASETIRHVGTVVHQLLQRIGREGLARWPAARLAALAPGFRLLLARRGVPAGELDRAAARVIEAIEHTFADARGRWILDPAHREARSEYALSLPEHGRIVTAVVDRTFVDGDGVRWIVDFKTGPHGGGGVEAFLDREQERYRAQLERYAAVLRRLDPRPIRLGLYFPLLSAWREWSPP